MKSVCRSKNIFAIAIVLAVICGLAGCCSDHNLEVVTQTPATCEEDGLLVRKCKECDYEETDVIPAIGHAFAEKIVKEASCASEGMVEKSCSICNKIETVNIDKTPHSYKITSFTEATFENFGIEESACTVCGDIKQKELAKLGTKENPGKVTIEQLVNEINTNKDAAKAKYNEQWIEITGKVLDADNVAGMTRFYLYGEHGGSGLRICCWVNEDMLKPFEYQGEVHTFLGQVREITTVNATEIGDCQIISD